MIPPRATKPCPSTWSRTPYYLTDANAISATVTILDDTPYTTAWTDQYRGLGFNGAIAALDCGPRRRRHPEPAGIRLQPQPAGRRRPRRAPAPRHRPSSPIPPAPADTLRHFPTLTFTRRTDAPNLTYAVETTTNLAANNWTSATPVFVSSTTANMPANTEQAVYRAPLPQDGPNAAPPPVPAGARHLHADADHDETLPPAHGRKLRWPPAPRP